MDNVDNRPGWITRNTDIAWLAVGLIMFCMYSIYDGDIVFCIILLAANVYFAVYFLRLKARRSAWLTVCIVCIPLIYFFVENRSQWSRLTKLELQNKVERLQAEADERKKPGEAIHLDSDGNVFMSGKD